ncbi:GntR family transcriptional regulator [Cellulomonas sp. DKR-3]|uniref:GntR family transcriptional regulator n=1 Tax=Cellulomonas fulva TaxID=2835530 RepID=A0ABS5TX63_9CELL|nr:GntR family transcriptional regulator [Cellulomonas fulva]
MGLADRSLATKIYLELRERIIQGAIKPGERIRERELAEELDVSRIPLREALPRLEAEGFIRTLPRRGAVVTELSLRDVEELFEVRTSLEVLATRLATEACASGADGSELTEALHAAEAALASGDDAEIASVNSTLHEKILRLSGNSLLQLLMVPVNGRVRRLFFLEAERDQQVLCAEHRDLCRAILDGHVELAGSLAFAHVEHSKVESLALMRTRLATAPAVTGS